MSNELLDYFKGDELAAGVWKGKYALATENTPDDMHKRLVKEFIKIEEKYQKQENLKDFKNLSEYGQNRQPLTEQSIYEMFKDFKYIVPQGRVMSGLGANESFRSLSNCLRLPPPKDSYSSIMYSDTMLVSAAKRGCGYGLGLSGIRPEGASVSNAASSSTGAHSFMDRYSNSTREVAQDGRRGACLEDIDIKHPDSLKFINAKRDRTKVTGANISVKCTDDFYEAVESNSDFILRYPCDMYIDKEALGSYNFEYNALEKYSKGYIKKIKAKQYFDAIIENAWENAEPGIFNWSRVLDYDPSSVYKKFVIDGTNACGEQPMAVYDTCRLILHNLFSYVNNAFLSNAEIDFDLLYKMSYEQMRLGDDLVDLEIEYIDRILNKIESDNLPRAEKLIEITLWENVRDIAKSGRRVGCGITALGDMLAALNLKYDSEEALKTVDRVMHTKMKAELDCSIDLSIIRGSFEGFDHILEKDGNSWYVFMENTYPEQWNRMQKYGRRNINFNTIAPAGSVSILTQTTSGCEPIFMPFYMRRKKINPSEKGIRVDFVDQIGDSWQEFPVMHQKFKDWMIIKGFQDIDYDKNVLQSIFEQSPWYKSTANDINWVKRVEMQSILQKYTTSAISSTLNLPNEATKEEVAEIYLQAWKMGLKGVTVYRDGSRSGVLVDSSKEVKTNFEYKDAVKRPKQLSCDIYSAQSKGKKWNILVGLLEDKPYEVFIVNYFTEEKKLNLVKKARGKYDLHKGKEIYSENVTSEMSDEQAAITRLTSTSLRHGTDIKYVVEQLNKCEGDLYSFTKSLARTLKKYIPDGTKAKETCPDCGGTNVVYQEGCKTCLDCGSGKCS